MVDCFSRRSGQSLVEVVVVTGIVMLILVALVAGAMIAVRNSQFSRASTRAIQLSREATEWLRGERKNSWSELVNHSGDYCLESDLNFDISVNASGNCPTTYTIIDDQFTRKAALTKESSEKVKITVTTSWTDSNGEHNEQVITYLTKW